MPYRNRRGWRWRQSRPGRDRQSAAARPSRSARQTPPSTSQKARISLLRRGPGGRQSARAWAARRSKDRLRPADEARRGDAESRRSWRASLPHRPERMRAPLQHNGRRRPRAECSNHREIERRARSLRASIRSRASAGPVLQSPADAKGRRDKRRETCARQGTAPRWCRRRRRADGSRQPARAARHGPGRPHRPGRCGPRRQRLHPMISKPVHGLEPADRFRRVHRLWVSSSPLYGSSSGRKDESASRQEKSKGASLRRFTIAAPVNLNLPMTQNNHKPAPPDEGFSLISRQKLLTLYSAMLRCRSISERSMAPTKSGNSVVGHEAVAVGAAIDLHPHDTVAAARWPQSALKEINPSVSIAPSISFASRSALREKGGRGITVLFASGKEKSQSSWMSALTFAGGHNLPFLFVSLSGPNASEEIAWAEALSMKGKKYSLPL